MNHPSGIREAAMALRAGTTTSVDLVTGALAQMDRFESDLGAIVVRCDGAALDAAHAADRALAQGDDRGPLHGLPIGVKDVLATANVRTTAQSSAMLDGYQGYDSRAVARLREAHAVVIGKAACSEFACGLPDPDKPFRPPRNPWDMSRWAGGSSGGSAAGLLAGYFLASIGTDTGGSIRVPAAFCGVTGLKPTRGLVSTAGCVPLSRTMDHVGPMARSAYDCALLLNALAEPAVAAGRDYTKGLDGDLTGIRVGVERDVPESVRLGGFAEIFESALECLKERGAELVDFSMPHAAELFAATRVVIAAEALDVHRTNLRDKWEDYGRQTRLSLCSGAFVNGSEVLRARAVILEARANLNEAFHRIDVLASLTCPMVAWQLDSATVQEVLSVPIMTSRWNALGCPAVSAPIGMVRTEGSPGGLPLGMQLASLPGADSMVLRVAHALQLDTSHHQMTPPQFNSAHP
jgi:aspartyl-tRNA(Asn)/glutamyl-tRNA(Gln) amidotransferase subunit A